MFRNNSRTQTIVGQSNVLGSSNDTFSLPTTRSSHTNIRNNVRNEIMFAILTSNLQEVRRLVNSSNSNDIIDTTNGYTALHHAVRIRGNDNIIEYLMSVGANPKLKQNENKDAIDLSIESNYRFLIDKLLNKNESELNEIYNKFDNINYEYKNLKRKNEELVEENTYLKKSSSQYVEKIDKLKSENDNLQIKYENSEKAFANLLKKTKKN
jgi:FtsZ-binding cell division protein ZapB